MRIAMLSPVVGDAYGQERVMRDSTHLLRGAGHEVSFIAESSRGAVPENDGLTLVPGLSALRWNSRRSAVNEVLTRVHGALDKFQPDIVHLVDQFDFRVQEVLCANYPVFLTSHLMSTTCPSSTRLTRTASHRCEEKSGWKCVVNHHRFHCLTQFKSDLHRAEAVFSYLRRRRSLRNVKGVGAVSEYVKRTLIADGWDVGKIYYVPNPIIEESSEKLKSAPPNLISCVARLEPYKGIDVLVHALKRLENYPWSLWVCGEGSDKLRLLSIVDKLGLTNRIMFLGNTPFPGTRKIMASSQFVVQPNRGPEPFGLSVAEAGSLGIATVATDVPALNEIIVDKKTGLLARAGDPVSLAEKIRFLFEVPELAKRLGENARASVLERYCPESHLRATLTAYRSCVASPEAASEFAPSFR